MSAAVGLEAVSILPRVVARFAREKFVVMSQAETAVIIPEDKQKMLRGHVPVDSKGRDLTTELGTNNAAVRRKKISFPYIPFDHKTIRHKSPIAAPIETLVAGICAEFPELKTDDLRRIHMVNYFLTGIPFQFNKVVRDHTDGGSITAVLKLTNDFPLGINMPYKGLGTSQPPLRVAAGQIALWWNYKVTHFVEFNPKGKERDLEHFDTVVLEF